MAFIAEIAISLGLPVFPCRADKRPACAYGFKAAETTPDGIRRLWSNYPGELIGVPTGQKSGFSVIDIDPQGIAWLKAKLGRGHLAPTRVHQTPRGGYHLLYRTPAVPLANSAGKLAHAVDIRGEGGYVIFPPSAGYRVLENAALTDFPSWVLGTLHRKSRAKPSRCATLSPDASALVRFIAASPEGQRNNRVFWAACRAAEAGLPVAELLDAACAAGLGPIEAERTVRSALRHARNGGNL